jgi:hypothetical protein
MESPGSACTVSIARILSTLRAGVIRWGTVSGPVPEAGSLTGTAGEVDPRSPETTRCSRSGARSYRPSHLSSRGSRRMTPQQYAPAASRRRQPQLMRIGKVAQSKFVESLLRKHSVHHACPPAPQQIDGDQSIVDGLHPPHSLPVVCVGVRSSPLPCLKGNDPVGRATRKPDPLRDSPRRPSGLEDVPQRHATSTLA